MPHVVVRSVPFHTRLANKGAKDILARDQARAKKLLAGLHPHGPAAFHEARQRRLNSNHHDGSVNVQTELASEGDNANESIDVTDAGKYVDYAPI
jgi:hypothetical protein